MRTLIYNLTFLSQPISDSKQTIGYEINKDNSLYPDLVQYRLPCISKYTIGERYCIEHGAFRPEVTQ